MSHVYFAKKTSMKQYCSFTIILLFVSLVLSACSNEPNPTPTKTFTPTTAPVLTATTTSTPDPCAPENISDGVEQIHRLMREFDDASMLASNTPLDQLNPTIANLQRIRRDAEDLHVPLVLLP